MKVKSFTMKEASVIKKFTMINPTSLVCFQRRQGTTCKQVLARASDEAGRLLQLFSYERTPLPVVGKITF